MVTGYHTMLAIGLLLRICGQTHGSITALPAQSKGLTDGHSLERRKSGKSKRLRLRDGSDSEGKACEEGSGKHGLELQFLVRGRVVLR